MADLIDPRSMAKQETKAREALIVKGPKEKLSDFYERAATENIGLKCRACGKTRPMAIGRCLICGAYENTQCRLRGVKGSPNDPAVKEAVAQTREAEAAATQPTPNDDNYSFTPEGESKDGQTKPKRTGRKRTKPAATPTADPPATDATGEDAATQRDAS